MGAARAGRLVRAIEAAGARVWVDGGWGVDALIGEEPRVHIDIDMVFELSFLGRVTEALGRLGYAVAEDHRPTRLVMVEPRLGTTVDLHPVVFQPDGAALQLGAGPGGGDAGGGDAVYPADGFARGRIGGSVVGCLSPELQVAHHSGYQPGAVDVADMARLCRRFRLPWPADYPPLYPERSDGAGSDLPDVTRVGLSPARRVERVGPTARRPVGPWSPDVHALLAGVRRAGFLAAPEVLGIDGEGREVLGWVEGSGGWVEGSGPHPELVRPGALEEVGRLLRRLHDAAGDRTAPGAGGERPFRGPRPLGSPDPDGPDAVMGHGDVAPWNLVARDGRIAALIDWDLAGPTTPLWELAGAAWRLVPLYRGPADWPLAEPSERRLQDLADGYGLRGPQRRLLVPTVIRRMESLADTIRTWGAEGIGQWAGLLASGHDRVEEDMAAVAAAERRLTAALVD